MLWKGRTKKSASVSGHSRVKSRDTSGNGLEEPPENRKGGSYQYNGDGDGSFVNRSHAERGCEERKEKKLEQVLGKEATQAPRTLPCRKHLCVSAWHCTIHIPLGAKKNALQ